MMRHFNDARPAKRESPVVLPGDIWPDTQKDASLRCCVRQY